MMYLIHQYGHFVIPSDLFFSPNAMAPPCAGLWTSECLAAEREPGGRGDVAVETTEGDWMLGEFQRF